MTGRDDYLLRIVVPDIQTYDSIYMRLIATAELSDVTSSFAMETIKYTTALPLKYAVT
jgi:Lrp/AsnC family transcriptional regulator